MAPMRSGSTVLTEVVARCDCVCWSNVDHGRLVFLDESARSEYWVSVQ